MLLGKHKPLKIELERFQLESAKSVNLLGITIDHNLTFDTLKVSAELEMPRMKNKQNYCIILLFCQSLITVL